MLNRQAPVATTWRRKDAWSGGSAYASGCDGPSLTFRVAMVPRLRFGLPAGSKPESL